MRLSYAYHATVMKPFESVSRTIVCTIGGMGMPGICGSEMEIDRGAPDARVD